MYIYKMNQTLSTFLKTHCAVKGGEFTHTRIGDKDEKIFGGSYNIPDDELETFMNLYYQEVFEKGQPEYMTEKQLNNGAIMVDFDFRYDTKIETRQHEEAHIIDMVIIYNEEIRKIINMPENETYEVYILEKPNVNCLTDKTKDGIHMIICLNMQRDYQMLLRKMVSPRIKDMWDDLPLTNTIDDIIDEGVVKAFCNWQMFGSCKPNNETYAIKYAYTVAYDDFKNIELKEENQKDIFFKISARNQSHKSFPINENIELPLDSGYSTPTPTNIKTSNKSVQIKTPTDDKFIDLLFNVIKNDIVNGNKVINRSNGYWYKICGALLSNGYDKKIWLDYCNPRSDPKNDTASKLWDNMAKNPREVSMYTLVVIAKIIDLNGYNEWVIKHKQYISIKTLNKGENDIAENISHKLKDKLKFCYDKWYLYDRYTFKWEVVKDPSELVISHIQRCIDESRETLIFVLNRTEDVLKREKLNGHLKTYELHYKKITGAGISAQIVKLLKSYLKNNNFIQKLDIKPFQVVYKNGILNLKTLEFKKGLEANDYLTHYIDYDYEESNEKDMNWIEEQLKKICNYTDEHLHYYLSILGYTMTGDSATHQDFYCLRGQTADNGKSVIFEALEEVIPNYIKKLDSKIFETTYANRHKNIANWGGKRIVWINELSKKKQDAEIMKIIADGKPIEYPVMFGTTSDMPISFKLFIIGNHTIKYDDDNGMNRRIKILQLDSDFNKDNTVDDYVNKKFIRDNNFCNLLTTKYKHALMSLIYKYSKMYVDDGYKLKPFPGEWNKETKETIESNNKFKIFFDENFDIGLDKSISMKDMQSTCSNYKGGEINIKDEIKKLKISSIKYDSQMEKKKQKGWFIGFGEKKEESSDQP